MQKKSLKKKTHCKQQQTVINAFSDKSVVDFQGVHCSAYFKHFVSYQPCNQFTAKQIQIVKLTMEVAITRAHVLFLR